MNVGDYVLAHYRGQGILRLCRLEAYQPVWNTWLLTAEHWGGNSSTSLDAIKWVFGPTKPTRREIHEARMALRS